MSSNEVSMPVWGSIDFDWSAEDVVATLRMSKDRLAR